MAKTTTRVDKNGVKVKVPVGLDGKNAVSPQNPPEKAVRGEVSSDEFVDRFGESTKPKKSASSKSGESGSKSDK